MSDDEVMVRERLVRLLGSADGGARTRPGAVPLTGPGSRRKPAVRVQPSPPEETGRATGLALTKLGSPGETGPAEVTGAPGGTGVADATGAPRQPQPSPHGGSGRLGGPGPFDPGRRGGRALAVVAAVVVVAAAAWAWWSRPRTEPVAQPSVGGSVGASASSDPRPAVSPSEVVVAVAGKVRRPGLVRLPAGARVADALAAAGGAQPGVDTALLNLARKVTDGELILVGVTPPPGAAPPGVASDGAAGVAPGTSGKVNLNTATVAQLDALPGVGPVLAQRIIEHRERIGGFRSVGDLRQVNGIGDARYEELKDLVTV